jgi:hypothetical protein
MLRACGLAGPMPSEPHVSGRDGHDATEMRQTMTAGPTLWGTSASPYAWPVRGRNGGARISLGIGDRGKERQDPSSFPPVADIAAISPPLPVEFGSDRSTTVAPSRGPCSRGSRDDGGHAGYLRKLPTAYEPLAGPGLWVPTVPGYLRALQPAWGANRTFCPRHRSEIPSLLSPTRPIPTRPASRRRRGVHDGQRDHPRAAGHRPLLGRRPRHHGNPARPPG